MNVQYILISADFAAHTCMENLPSLLYTGFQHCAIIHHRDQLWRVMLNSFDLNFDKIITMQHDQIFLPATCKHRWQQIAVSKIQSQLLLVNRPAPNLSIFRKTICELPLRSLAVKI